MPWHRLATFTSSQSMEELKIKALTVREQCKFRKCWRAKFWLFILQSLNIEVGQGEVASAGKLLRHTERLLLF